MLEINRIEAEKNEVRLLLDKGMKFEVERKVSVQNGFLWWKKVEVKKEKLEFTIKEPTLYILDLISSEQIEIGFDHEQLKKDSISYSKRLAKENSKRLAKIVALAVLGEDYVIAIRNGENTSYSFDDEKLCELTALFLQNIKPSTLVQYVLTINSLSNYGDFMSSIRLMSANRTTAPTLIEEKAED